VIEALYRPHPALRIGVSTQDCGEGDYKYVSCRRQVTHESAQFRRFDDAGERISEPADYKLAATFQGNTTLGTRPIMPATPTPALSDSVAAATGAEGEKIIYVTVDGLIQRHLCRAGQIAVSGEFQG
jgi:hypothetical protein